MSQTKYCPFTGAPATFPTCSFMDVTIVDSDACGTYYVSRALSFEPVFREALGGKEPIPSQGLINCARRSLEIHKEGLTAFWAHAADVEKFRKEFAAKPKLKFVACSFEEQISEPVDHSEKPYVLLDAMASSLGDGRPYRSVKLTVRDQAWARICDKDELAKILMHLKERGLVRVVVPTHFQGFSEIVSGVFKLSVEMSVSGWAKVRERNSFPNSNKVFIAIQFDWPGEEALHAEAVEAIKRACKNCGYAADVVSQHHTESITDRIIADIRRSRFVVAEFTYNNRGVYYEAGYARGRDIPVFHVVREGFTSEKDQEGKRIHFDIQQIMYKTWTTAGDLESKLTDWIEARVGKFGEVR